MVLKQILIYFAFFSVLSSCKNSSNRKDSKDESETKPAETNNCKCSQKDAEWLVSKIEIDFAKSQFDVDSQDARVLREIKLEKRPNCTWVATFELSYPFGNTDGMHPSETIKKRFICDGIELYTE
ncbi:MAG: hypothetical protein ABIP79_09755 [Chitinophagaceae bacterium]